MIVLTKKESIAWKLAEEVHMNQKRRNGRPYIEHIEKTVEILRSLNVYDEDLTITAILHDVLEECDKKQTSKYANKILDTFGADVIANVLILTHQKRGGKSYQEYIDDIIKTKSCIIVKVADMLQNITDAPTPKQLEKYRIAFTKLISSCISQDIK